MTRPIAAHRHDSIVTRLRSAGIVSVEELATSFDVSRETIRRDLKALQAQGRLDIVHGGAVRKADAAAPRRRNGGLDPTAIGRAAAELVTDGMVVVIDSGTTAVDIAGALGGRTGLTVVTNSLPVAQLVCHMPGTRVHMLGGEVNAVDEACFGPDVMEAISRFRFDVAFVIAGGVSSAGEITDVARMPAEQRGRMLASAARSYVVADRSKFGRLTPIPIPNSDQVTAVITDERPPQDIADALTRRGAAIIVAGG